MPPRNQHKKRCYSDAEKAHALLALQANGGNVALTAKEQGIPLSTMQNWGRGEVHPAVLEMEEEFKKPLLERLDRAIDLLLASVPTKIDAAPLKHTTDSLTALIDRGQLLRGEPTSIAAKTSTDEQLFQQLQRLAEHIRTAKSANGSAVVGASAVLPTPTQGGPASCLAPGE